MTDPSALQIVLLVVLGLVAGAVNAVAGGGSLIVFPVLLGVGLPPLQANVTNSVAQWPGYVGSTLSARSDLVGQRRRAVLTGIVAVLGSVVGCSLLLVLPASVFDAIVPVLVLLASITLGFQPQLKRASAAAAKRRRERQGLEHEEVPEQRWGVLLPVTFVACVYGGYFGGALGVILIAVLSLLVNDSLQRLNALKVLLSLLTATASVVIFAIFAPVNWFAVLLLAPSTLIGGYLGILVAKRMPDAVLRWSVVVLGIAVAIYLFVRG